MKKLGKFVFGTLSLASLAAGAYYVYKNFIKKDYSDDFDEFEDDFDDFDDFEGFDAEEGTDEFSETRAYVPLQTDKEDTNKEDTDKESDMVNIASNSTDVVSNEADEDTDTSEDNQ